MATHTSSSIVIIATALVLLAGCSDSPSSLPESRDFDFFGVVSSADLEEWVASGNESTVGGPNSDQRVGPGTLLLSSGEEIEIEPQTPGGDLCRLLSRSADETTLRDCIVIGEYAGESQVAQWFGLLSGRSAGSEEVRGLRLEEIDEHAALIAAPFDEAFRFPVAATLGLDCLDSPPEMSVRSLADLPEAAEYAVSINLVSQEVVSVECLYSD